jgi:hypothetical protein
MSRAPAPASILRLVPVAVCALAAHAVLYRSLTPHDGVHGYLGTYEAVVGLVSLVSFAVVAVAAAWTVTGRATVARRMLAPLPVAPTRRASARRAALGLAVLAMQESAERSVAAGHAQGPGLGVAAWAIAILTVVAASAVLDALARAGGTVLRLLEARCGTIVRPRAVLRSPDGVTPRRRRVLADRHGVRAPPLAA